MQPGAVQRLGLGVTLIIATGCSVVPDRPAAGATWQIEAVDQAGAFGTITIERGEIIPVPPGSHPVATHGVLVHISYEPDRPSESGFGELDWGARLSREENAADLPPRLMALVSDPGWPAEPLGSKLPDVAEPLAGWIVVAVTELELAEEILLRYQPHIVPDGNGLGAELVSEITIHVP